MDIKTIIALVKAGVDETTIIKISDTVDHSEPAPAPAEPAPAPAEPAPAPAEPAPAPAEPAPAPAEPAPAPAETTNDIRAEFEKYVRDTNAQILSLNRRLNGAAVQNAEVQTNVKSMEEKVNDAFLSMFE